MFWSLLLFPLFYAGVGQLLGQDTNWDLQNYHYFDPYWVLVNHMRDTNPAQLETYLSPILDIPYYIGTEHIPPRLMGLVLAVIQGTAFPLLYLISRHFTADRLVALGLAGLGMFTAGAISELGNIMGDALLAPLFLAAILLGLRSFDALRSHDNRRVGPTALIVAASGVAGFTAGLKLSELPIAVGIAAAFPLSPGSFTRRVQKAVWAGGALIVGCLLSYGWWGYELATRYGNPILPFLNQIFHSAYAPAIANSGNKIGLVDILFFPFIWTLHPARVGDPPFLEASLPISEVLLITLLVITVGRSVLQHRRIEMFNSDKQRYLVLMVIVSYVLWSVEFGIYRYLISLEMVSFILIFVCLQAISVQIGWKPLVTVGTIALALVCVLSEQPMNWGRSAWSATYFSVAVPKSLESESAAFLMLGTNPDAFVVPSFPHGDYFAQIEGSLPPTPYVMRQIQKNVNGYRAVFTLWENPVPQTPSAFAESAQNSIETYGYQVDWSTCTRFTATVGANPKELHTCRLKKVSLSTLPPVTSVVTPASGHVVVGQQELAARAYAADGLRRVEFSITGEGRTVEVRAADSLYGWLGAWSTKSTPNGLYTVRSIAYSRNGLVDDSAAVTVEVKNEAAPLRG